jgi:hypothetical protein
MGMLSPRQSHGYFDQLIDLLFITCHATTQQNIYRVVNDTFSNGK